MNLIIIMRNDLCKKLCICIFILVYAVLFVMAINKYQGSSIYYTFFSIIFLTLIVSGFVGEINYSYMFMSTMLWLGFWLKITIHLILDYPYRESIGDFNGLPASWDGVLIVASIGSLGCILPRFIYIYMQPFKLVGIDQLTMLKQSPVLRWYSEHRIGVWAGMLLALLVVVITNVMLGILQIGMVPRTILPWPLNAIISLMIGHFMAIGFCTVLWWDIVLKHDAKPGIYFLIIEAFLTSISVLSRGTYIFHVAPTLIAIYYNKMMVVGVRLRNAIVLMTVTVTLFVISIGISNSLRENFYANTNKVENWKINGFVMGGVVALAIDRWIGLEGVMCIWAYPNKNDELMIQGLKERRAIGNDTLYNHICRPKYYGDVDRTRYQLTEIPGAIAFLFYADRLIFVWIGMFIITTFLLLGELFVFTLTANPILTAVWGGVMANTIVQMGVAPKSTMLPVFFIGVSILIIGFLQCPALINKTIKHLKYKL